MADVQQEPGLRGRARHRRPTRRRRLWRPPRHRPMTPPNAHLSLPVGLSTGIGHLPHCDPGDAVEFVLRHNPRLPAAPSLPARSRREGMVAQAAAGIQGVTVHDDGTLDLDPSLIDPEAPLGDLDFAGDAYGGLRAFLTAVADRDGAIKVSLTGPVTLGVALHAAGLDADLAFAVAGAAVRRRAAALVDHLLRRVPQAQLVVFVDEPAMASLPRRASRSGPPKASTSCRGPWPSSSGWRSRGCTAATRPTTGCCSAPVPGSCPSPSTAASSATPACSATTSTAAAGSPGERCPPTARSAPRSSGCGAACRPCGATSRLTAAIRCCCAPTP